MNWLRQQLRSPAAVCGLAFLVLSGLAMLMKPMAFERYFILKTGIFDALHYVDIARSGYSNPAELAFYPLWPIVLMPLASLFSEAQLAFAGGILALLLFGMSLPLLQRVYSELLPKPWATLALAVFVLNPNSLFHALAYSESLFTLLTAVFFCCALVFLRSGSMGAAFGLTLALMLMSATRPILLQVVSAAVGAWLVSRILGGERRGGRLALLICVAAGLGYLPYGLFCSANFESFFSPFHAQSHWDRKFDFYWQLLLQPKSVSGSDHVLFWDLLAFYLPVSCILLVGIGALRLKKNNAAAQRWFKPKALQDLSQRYLFWFSASFAAAHAGIALLSYPIFMSLSRHVFALPFSPWVLAAVGSCFVKERIAQRSAKFFVVVNGAFFIYWWFRYARIGWLG